MAKHEVIKDASYHEAAIEYNREIAEFATELSNRLTHPVVKAWARSVARQHNLHLERHNKSLGVMKSREKAVDTYVDHMGKDGEAALEGSVIVSETPIDNPVPEQETVPEQTQNETAIVAEEQENNA